jgi:hypothetical protein
MQPLAAYKSESITSHNKRELLHCQLLQHPQCGITETIQTHTPTSVLMYRMMLVKLILSVSNAVCVHLPNMLYLYNECYHFSQHTY